MKYTRNGIIYDVVISDGAIELQSLTETIFFQNAYTEICNELEKEYRKEGHEHRFNEGRGDGLKSYIDYYEDQYIRSYLDEHRNDGVTLEFNLN